MRRELIVRPKDGRWEVRLSAPDITLFECDLEFEALRTAREFRKVIRVDSLIHQHRSDSFLRASG
jgi:hypothetical protein